MLFQCNVIIIFKTYSFQGLKFLKNYSLFIDFNFKYSSPRYLLIIGILLLIKVVINTTSSSLLLSITIQSPYDFIDSLEELQEREELIPFLYLSKTEIKQIMVFNN